ncbi:BTAD domain-containing putative transcriptional regulator [Actinomadura litoris]|uniref:LysM peptidoglycan-binding domain-containing protein n=1 Tax=Actinomadura litoris TaxID=2678616 RepID=A0A7K1KT65_9ACTN|nr:BTAD domain-containing putative transcriptional regulator [Actinomadura litoris]MUN35381.1 LysM peptidoglycan-binding domain-containing protein [Actinomadura litoris]
MTQLPRTRAAEICRGIAALLLVIVLLVGVPIGLYAVGGSPLPHQIPSWAQITATLMGPDSDQQVFLAAIGLLGWIAWVQFAIAVGTETVCYLAGRPARSLPRPARPLQLLARNLITTATLAFSATATLTTTSASAHTIATAPSAPHEPSPAQDTATKGTADGDGWEPFLGDGTAQHTESREPTWTTRIIHRGDNLWTLARRAYGSGTYYSKIFKASQRLDQPAGVPDLTDPNHLHPGQRVRLPQIRHRSAPSSDSAAIPPAKGPRPSAPVKAPGDDVPARPRPAPKEAASRQVPNPIVAPPRAPSPPAQTPHRTDDQQPSSSITLPSGSTFGLGLAAALSIAVAATRLHRRRRHHPADTVQDTAPAEPPPPPVAKARKAYLDRAFADHDAPVPSDAELLTSDHTTPAPEHTTLGTRNDSPIRLPLAGLSLGLHGDGAHATARAITIELLGKASRDRAQLLLPQPDFDLLFPGSDLTSAASTPPGLTITPTVAAAVAELETELLRRARLLEITDQPDLAALRAADPAEPLPTLLLVASIPEHAAAVNTIAQLGHRHGIGALILNPWSHGTSLHLTEHATVTHAEGPHADTLTGAHLFHLTSDDARAMLAILRSATGTPPSETEDAPPSPRPAQDHAPVPAPRPAPELPTPPRPSGNDQPRPIRLQLLGPVQLHTTNGPITTGLRRSARDLLAYLALHPNGITRAQAISHLWPDHPPAKATSAFNTAVANIRKTLRTATGLREPMFLIHTTGLYRLDAVLIDVDLWHLTTTLSNASRATNAPDRIAALTPAPDLYTGHFASDLTHEWAETHREHLRRRTIDALADLADLLQHDHPERALITLEYAITHDPYGENLYRTIMKLQTHLGHPDAAQRTYQLLASRLTDLDAEPDDQTHQLLTDLQRSPNP